MDKIIHVYILASHKEYDNYHASPIVYSIDLGGADG